MSLHPDDPDLRSAVCLLAQDDEPVHDLLPGALAHGRAVRRRRRVVTAAASVVALVAGTLVGTAVIGRDGGTRDGPVAGTTASDPGLPSGYRWVSAYGAEVAVPQAWRVQAPRLCRDPGAGTVELGRAENADAVVCPYFGRTTEWVQMVYTVTDPTAAGGVQSGREVTVDGQRAYDTRLPGKPSSDAAGTQHLAVPQWLAEGGLLQVIVRTGDGEVLDQILDSVRLPAVDHAGCPTTDPVSAPALDVSTEHPYQGVVGAGLCVYDPVAEVLLGSERVSEPDLPRVVGRLQRPDEGPLVACHPSAGQVTPYWLLLRFDDGSTAIAAVTSCAGTVPAEASQLSPLAAPNFAEVASAPEIGVTS